MKNFIKDKISNILIIIAATLLIVPQTRMPIQVFARKLFLFSPSETSQNQEKQLEDYDITLQTLKGEHINVAQSKGKVILINFWATWCPPCVAEMPSLQELYTAYGDQVDFYFITNEEAEKVQSFIEKHQYTFPVQLQMQQLPSFFDVTSIPRTYVIAKDGKIFVDETGAANWNAPEMHVLIDKLLK